MNNETFFRIFHLTEQEVIASAVPGEPVHGSEYQEVFDKHSSQTGEELNPQQRDAVLKLVRAIESTAQLARSRVKH